MSNSDTILHTIARYRAQHVVAIVAAKGESTEGLEEDAFGLFLALEQHKAEKIFQQCGVRLGETVG